MTTVNYTTLNQTLADLFNVHNSNPAWLDTLLTVLTADCEVIDQAHGLTYSGLDGLKNYFLIWATAFPDATLEITNNFST